jgi:hypothetical protein
LPKNCYKSLAGFKLAWLFLYRSGARRILISAGLDDGASNPNLKPKTIPCNPSSPFFFYGVLQ